MTDIFRNFVFDFYYIFLPSFNYTNCKILQLYQTEVSTIHSPPLILLMYSMFII